MKKFLPVAFKVGISAALLYLAVNQVDLGSLGERLARIEPGWLVAAVAVMGLQTFVVALRWREIALQCGAPIRAMQSFRFTMIATLFNQALPSTVGGDAARIWLLAREGAGFARATYSVVVDRAAGVLVLAVLVLVCLPWSFDLIRSPAGRAALVAIGLVCFLVPASFAMLGMRRWPLLERWRLTSHVAEAAAVAGRLMRHPRTGGAVVLLSAAVHLLTVAAAWLVARSVAAPLEFSHALLLVLPVLMVSMIPISIAGWGVREGAMVMAFAYAGLAESDGLLVSVLLGGAMFALGIAGGLVWLTGGREIRGPAQAQLGGDQTR